MFDLSPKQKDFIKNSDARMNISVGAVRSGKSFCCLIKWLKHIQTCPDGNLVMVGRTATTIKRNIVDVILDLIGADAKYYLGKQEITLWGKRIYLVGASDESSESKIRGSTFAAAFIDEITLIPESFWIMLLSRLSLPGAKLFGSTNPDSSFHWLKKNYIDRSDELDIKTWSFNLDDNPSLTESFKDSLRKEYRGLWYKRFIEGEWVQAEGTIYDFFDETVHCVDFAPTSSRYYVCGIDYGTTNPCAFTLVSYNPDNFPNLVVEDEYYWNSREKNRQKTDSEYADDLERFLMGKNIKAIIIDPSAASFKAELMKKGMRNIVDADNDVINGIRTVGKFLSNGTLKIARKCKNTIKEMQTYVWDEKSIRYGEDKPLKQNDHILDALRYVIHTHFKSIYDGTGEKNVEEYRRWKAEQGWR